LTITIKGNSEREKEGENGDSAERAKGEAEGGGARAEFFQLPLTILTSNVASAKITISLDS